MLCFPSGITRLCSAISCEVGPPSAVLEEKGLNNGCFLPSSFLLAFTDENTFIIAWNICWTPYPVYVPSQPVASSQPTGFWKRDWKDYLGAVPIFLAVAKTVLHLCFLSRNSRNSTMGAAVGLLTQPQCRRGMKNQVHCFHA